ncbi:Iron-sulfur cluster assembly factor IBA57 [Balamuthia mandrillaris]
MVTSNLLKGLKQCYVQLHARSLLHMSGADTLSFLQGLTTNNVLSHLSSPSSASTSSSIKTKAMYTALLNTSGRVLTDCIVLGRDPAEGGVLIDCDKRTASDLLSHFKKFKFRKKVELRDVSEERLVLSILDSKPEEQSKMLQRLEEDEGWYCFRDPRLPAFMGLRAVLPRNKDVQTLLPYQEVDENVYHLYRLLHGIPEGSDEMPWGDPLPLEYNLDLLNGVSFNKGCYIGQELTSRVHYTGVIRKRVAPVVAIDATSKEDRDLAESLAQDITREKTGDEATLFPPSLFSHSFYTQRVPPRNTSLVEATLDDHNTEATTSSKEDAPTTTAGRRRRRPPGTVTSEGVFNIGLALLRSDHLESFLSPSAEPPHPSSEDDEDASSESQHPSPSAPSSPSSSTLLRPLWPQPWWLAAASERSH